MKKFIAFTLLILVGFSFSIAAEGVVIDGWIDGSEEYSNKQFSKAYLFWRVDGEKLHIGIRAATEGWIAVGLGSARMDGSKMFMGYYKDGESFFEEHLGRGHSHSKVENDREVEFALAMFDGFTFMEFSVPKDDFLSPGENTLPVIIAYGNRDNFRSMHRYRDSGVIEF